MRSSRLIRFAQWVSIGAVVLQLNTCTPTETLNFVQTVFLGITAAGSVALLQNL